MATEQVNTESNGIPTIAEHVRTLLQAAPPMTDEQIARVRYLLAPLSEVAA